MTGPRLLDLNAEIDRLYQRDLSTFVAERNALASRVKDVQGKDAAQHIKTLEKPSLVAWVINQLHWRFRTDFTALLLAGDAARLAQQQRLGGADVDLGPPMRSRQAAMDTLLAHASDLVKAAGSTPSPEMRQRLMSTLDALATYGTGESAPRTGRLTREVVSPGFDTLAALLPAVSSSASAPAPGGAPRSGTHGPPKLTVVARRERQKAEAALAAAESTLADARSTADAAKEASTTAEAAWQAARQAVAEHQRALDRAVKTEEDTLHERDQRKRDVSRATLGVRDAERAVEAAARAVRD